MSITVVGRIFTENSYQANDNKRVIANETPSRTAQGLPELGLVFCCFNHNYKITPEVFDIWLNCLLNIPDSVLWLLASHQQAVANLRLLAESRGISAERLIFAETLPSAEHLARLKLADLFLDTFPCNAHTTASDALWAGLPVLTCSGNSFVSRVAGSLLHALDLPELITEDLLAYEALILKLAHERTILTNIQTKLAQNKLQAALFDTKQFCQGLERVLEKISRKVCD